MESGLKKIIIATDAWEPQVNGVVTTLTNVKKELDKMGHEVYLITPYSFKRQLSNPFYPEVKLAWTFGDNWVDEFLFECLKSGDYDFYVHIVTEGPVGLYVRNWCIKNKVHFTTSYHTDWPMMLKNQIGIPKFLSRKYLRWFHKPAETIMLSTAGLMNEFYKEYRLPWTSQWVRGVDHEIFRPMHDKPKKSHKWFLYVGRVSKEKNLDAFLDLNLGADTHKIVVGDGPDLERLKKKYHKVTFMGALPQKRVAEMMNMSDVFVFPSKADTFGIVLIEAMACGLPIAAYPVRGPIDIVWQNNTGILDDDLRYACLRVAEWGQEKRNRCVNYASKYTWNESAKMFLNNLNYMIE